MGDSGRDGGVARVTGGFYSSGETGGDIHESIQVGNPGTCPAGRFVASRQTHAPRRRSVGAGLLTILFVFCLFYVLELYPDTRRLLPANAPFFFYHFTSLHFLKAPKTGQRTPAALSDS